MAKPAKKQLDAINARIANEPFDADDVHVCEVNMADDQLITDRYMRFRPRLLRKMAADAQAGNVPQMFDHAWSSIPVGKPHPIAGRMFAAKVQEKQGIQRVPTATGVKYQEGPVLMYTGMLATPIGKRSVRLGDGSPYASTADVAMAIDNGMLKDTSVGMWCDSRICSVCGLDIADEDCPHLPGGIYGKDGEKTVAVAEADVPGEQFENSWVMAGAVDSAGVSRASASPLGAIGSEMVGRIQLPNLKFAAKNQRLLITYGRNGRSVVYASLDDIPAMSDHLGHVQNAMEQMPKDTPLFSALRRDFSLLSARLSMGGGV